MNFINRLQRKFRLGIPNLMIYITATMLFVFAIEYIFRYPITQYLYFNRALLFQGQIWRLITFIIIPTSSSSVIMVLISLYFYYFIGSSLENAWGPPNFLSSGYLGLFPCE